MHITLLQSLLVTLVSASYLVERSIEDGLGDSTTVGAHLAWSYNGAGGPIYWDRFEPTCNGRIQSPINIEPDTVDFAKTLDGIVDNSFGLLPQIKYPDARGNLSFANLKFTPFVASGTFIRGVNASESTYSLAQFHFHSPSEHRVDGEDYPLEVHFVHTMADGANTKLAVIGAFIRFSDVTSPFLAQFVECASSLDEKTLPQKTIDVSFADVIARIKSSSAFYRYKGSLTTPPCTEGVQWLVASDAVLTITVEDYAVFKRILKHNSRITRPIADFYDDNWVALRKSDYEPSISSDVHYTPHFHYEYGYAGIPGPVNWHKFAPACKGKIQSPINIEPDVYDFKEVLNGVLNNSKSEYPQVTWPAEQGIWKNLGHTLQFTVGTTSGTFNRYDGKDWNLAQFHLHSPSEHHVDGVEYPLEVHFVHLSTTDSGTEIAVIGAFIELDTVSSPFIKQLADLSVTGVEMKGDSKYVPIEFGNAVSAIQSSKFFYRYTGSLTTPACTEGVNWLVASDANLKISVADYKILKTHLRHNARPTQPLYDFYDLKWEEHRKSTYYPEDVRV